MKTFLFLLLSFFTVLISCRPPTTHPVAVPSQDSLGFTNKAEAKNLMVNGKKEGKWVEYTDNIGNVITYTSIRTGYRLTIYVAGNPYGIVRDYNIGGGHPGLWRETIYSKGEINELKDFYDSGKIASVSYLKNGKANGIEKRYSYSGMLVGEYPWVNDALNGTVKDYYGSGKLKKEASWYNGTKNGIEKEYFENGALQSETFYIFGKMDPGGMQYYKNGKIRGCYSYSNGVLKGVLEYYESGKLQRYFNNINGKDINKLYYEKGNEMK